jgi:membrane peptidoglycan carboxypeptidase
VNIEGTGAQLALEPGLAAKTGTSVSGAWYMSFDERYRVLTWTENDFHSSEMQRFRGKAVSAKSLAARIWSLLATPVIGARSLYSCFAGVDSMSVSDLLWIEDEFQRS